MDLSYNKGPRFWYRLDWGMLSELEKQYAKSKSGNMSVFPGEVLFGMAQKVTGMKPSYLDRLLTYLTEAARKGFSPARAVYAQIMHAHEKSPEFCSDTLDEWTLQSVSEGYLFSSPSQNISEENFNAAKQRFCDSGGFCVDAFIGKSEIRRIAQDQEKVLQWQETGAELVDLQGNTMLHVAAALGQLNSVQALVEEAKVSIDQENDNQETALYKACQAGHVNIIHFLLDKGASASRQTKQEKLTALHWLFTISQESIRAIATRLVNEGGASVNAIIVPSVGESGDKSPKTIPLSHL